MPDALPIERHLPAITAALGPGQTVLLQAPPGAGKTTRVPLALLPLLRESGRVLVLEPRRLAARAAAERLAAGLGEPVGQQVGYSVRLETRCSGATVVEVVTGGILLRRLQADPALEGVSCVIFDEFHERGAEADLALALVRQARELLRPELRVLVMSATLDLAPLAAQLPEATVIASEGRSFPVTLEHQPPRPGERLDHQVVRALESHWLPERGATDTVLVFLPGQREISQAQRAIASCAWSAGLECVVLHGQLSLAEQARAIRPAKGAEGKVVLATAIAESSLTIEAVRLVIDSGLRRCSRFDPGTGMDGLVTVPASLASAEQRRGRAGRLGPGHCLRLWSPAEQQRRPAFDPPELLETDPVPIALQLACWGSPLGEDLPWLDPPPRPGLLEARELLRQLGALDQAGQLSEHGHALSRLGLHPRLGHLLLRAAEHGWLELACPLAVLLSERDPLDHRTAGSDLLRRLDWLRRGGEPDREGKRRPMLQLVERLRRQLQPKQHTPSPASDDAIAARLLSWAYPERVALQRGNGGGRFLMRGGRGAWLHPEDPLAAASGLAIAAVDGQGAEARVQLAVALPDGVLDELVAEDGTQECVAEWDGEAQRVRCERRLRLGALVLERRPWPEADAALVRGALLEGVRQLGLAALPWGQASRQLQARLCLAQRHLGPPWPERHDAALEGDLESWLAPHLDGLRSRQELQAIDLCEALWGDLPWARRQELAALLPDTLAVPSGRRVGLRYGAEEVVLAVKLQEMFGCAGLPALLEGRLAITVELLSPAGRPAAITRDLAGFWRNGYPEVRRELRGRYPRHPWPEDPGQAAATALTKAALKRNNAGGASPQAQK
jgi:ATP-dependent helicase HrpB